MSELNEKTPVVTVTLYGPPVDGMPTVISEERIFAEGGAFCAEEFNPPQTVTRWRISISVPPDRDLPPGRENGQEGDHP